MSDPLTRAEIEDVLSSIRRLVAEEGRMSRQGLPAEAGRLVLTPAQRVASAPDPVAAIRAAARRLAEAPAEAAQPAAAPAPPAAEPPPPRLAGGIAETGSRSLEQAIAELEAAVAAAHGEWEPDGGEPPGLPAPRAGGGSMPRPAEATATATAADNVHRLAPPPPRPPVVAPPAAAAGPAGSAAGLDEEGLRDLVVEILGEELQGALGERITRNVRKLVRAEIARALASRQLD